MPPASKLRDGTHRARQQFVASAIDVHQTFETLIGRAQLPASYLAKIDEFQYTGWTLFGLHLALMKPALHLGDVGPSDRPHAEIQHRRRIDRTI